MNANFPVQASATLLIETSNIEQLLEVSHQNTLIISDITNTLYKPCNMMSDKRWRNYLAQRVNETIPDPTLASKITNRIENIIVNDVDKILVHSNMPSVIRELQAKEIPLIAITLKNWSAPYDPNFGITTSNHLNKLAIDLEKSVPFIGKMKSDETTEYTFAKGIIFTNKNPLDKALDAFLNRLEKKPEHIVILENSHEHKEKFEAVLKAHNIALTFVKHASSENPKAPFDPSLGTIEFLRFMTDSETISDQEAKKIREENSSVDYETQLKDFIKGYQPL